MLLDKTNEILLQLQKTAKFFLSSGILLHLSLTIVNVIDIRINHVENPDIMMIWVSNLRNSNEAMKQKFEYSVLAQAWEQGEKL